MPCTATGVVCSGEVGPSPSWPERLEPQYSSGVVAPVSSVDASRRPPSCGPVSAWRLWRDCSRSVSLRPAVTANSIDAPGRTVVEVASSDSTTGAGVASSTSSVISSVASVVPVALAVEGEPCRRGGRPGGAARGSPRSGHHESRRRIHCHDDPGRRARVSVPRDASLASPVLKPPRSVGGQNDEIPAHREREAPLFTPL